MAKMFHVEVVTPEATALSAEVSSLNVPAWEGYLGVLAEHAPLLAVLTPGVLTVRDATGAPSFFAVRGGFMEVSRNRAVVLADDIVAAEDVDVAAARKLLDAPPPEPPQAPTIEQRRAAREVTAEEREEARRWAAARIAAAERRSEAA